MRDASIVLMRKTGLDWQGRPELQVRAVARRVGRRPGIQLLLPLRDKKELSEQYLQ